MFPLLAMLLSNGTIGDALVTELDATTHDPLEFFAPTEEKREPRLIEGCLATVANRGGPGRSP